MHPLFDDNGHVLSPTGLKAAARFNTLNSLGKPQKNFPGLVIGTLEYLFPKEVTFASVEEFTDRSEAIVECLRKNEATANILNGHHLPICIPKLEVSDYGNVFEKLFLKVLERAYGNVFPDRRFLNHLRGRLGKRLAVHPESRHQRLVARMSHRPVVGVYFPTAFHGYSAQVSRGMMRALPSNMLLAGGFDVATALIAYRDMLVSDTLMTDLSLAALDWQVAPDQLLSFKAWSNALTLNNEGKVDYPLSDFSGGILVVESDL